MGDVEINGPSSIEPLGDFGRYGFGFRRGRTLVFGALREAWVKANGFTDAPKGNGRTFAIAFVLTLVMAFNLAMFLNDSKTNVSWGATAGFLAGFGWIAMGIGVVAVFERKPLSYVLINGGYMTVALVLMGAIIGLWR